MADKQLALLGDGKVRDLPGGVEEYLRLRAARHREPGRAVSPRDRAAAACSPCDDEPAGGVPRVRDDGEPGRGARGAQGDGAHREAALASPDREERLHGDMAEKATDPAALADLNARLAGGRQESEELELEWLEAAEVVG